MQKQETENKNFSKFHLERHHYDAVCTVIGNDKVGIIAKVTTLLSSFQVNILDISQTILGDGIFSMIMLLDFSKSSSEFSKIIEAMEILSNDMGLQIKLQKSDVFEAMHRI